MKAPLPFETMPLAERVAILRALAQKLQIFARIAKHDDDPIWQSLLGLSVRLETCTEEVAADPCRGDDVVEKSLRLLRRFELCRSQETFPEFAVTSRH